VSTYSVLRDREVPVRCPNCETENPEQSDFCSRCGTQLLLRCDHCGAETLPDARFCAKCGTPLVEQPKTASTSQTVLSRSAREVAEGGAAHAPRSPETEERLGTHGERRQLTVLFCDLVGATELSARLDPEDFRDVVRAYQETCAAVISRFDGHIAQYLGDGLLVYFGFPRAHEDDAQRAVRAGLGMVEAIEGLNTRLELERGVSLALRVGIHTGLVVAGEMGGGEGHGRLAVGEAPNVAARLQGLAEPGTVVLSGATYRLVGGYFDCREMGLHSLKGLAQQVPVFQALHESAARSRLDVAAAVGLTPLVGREAEVSLLLEAWERAKEGSGRVVLLGGEPGIGKSRLVRVLAERVAQDPAAWLSPWQCSPYHQHAAFYPVIDVLERVVLEFRSEDGPENKLRKLEGWLVQYGQPPAEAVPLLATLLSVPLGDQYAPLMVTPERQKQQTVDLVVSALLLRAREQPMLLVVEDLQWADASTLELLDLLLERVESTRILALLTHRADFHPPWPGVSRIELTRLSAAPSLAMVEHVAGGKELPAEIGAQILARTDGVPLFVEELTKSVLESGLLQENDGRYELIGPLPPLAIPETLQASLLARLDRISTAREIAQIGASLGRDFSYTLLREVVASIQTLDDEILEQGLGQLVEAEILYQRGVPPGATYVFKHALIRDAAYDSLLKSRRHFFHRQIARVLEERFPETREAEPELLAHHYTESGLHEQALVYWQKAAQRAIERSANVEALAYLETALAELAQFPEGDARVEHELGLRVTLGVPLIATRGYAAAEVKETYARARELSLQVGETPQLPNILWGLWVFYLTGGPLPQALEMAEQYREVAEAHPDDSGLLLETCQLNGIALFYMGEFERALPYLERGSDLYDPAQHHTLIFAHGGADTGVALMTHKGLALWALGYPDRAREAMQAAMECARTPSHPFSLAFAHYFLAWFHTLCRDDRNAFESADAAARICDEFGFPFWGLSSTVLRGNTLVQQGNVEEGITEMRDSLASFEATGGLLYRSALRGLLAAALGRAGHPDEGLEVLDEALAALEGREERWWEPELHRLRGEVLRALPGDHVEEARASLQEALDIARRQHARSWELRAAASLARLWHDQGMAEDASALLAGVAGEFTEGLDTEDLREAQSLLADIESPVV
jgi:class 3 adenylate cyclase/predicted ATPase